MRKLLVDAKYEIIPTIKQAVGLEALFPKLLDSIFLKQYCISYPKVIKHLLVRLVV